MKPQLPLLYLSESEKEVFGKCFLEQMKADEVPLRKVSRDVSNGNFKITKRDKDGHFVLAKGEEEEGIPLFHCEDCPCKHDENIARDVRVAVCVVVENKGRVLLTRRNANMNTFSSVWVVPGGHVDLGEDLRKAAVREVEEETNIVIAADQLKELCFYESVFPVEGGSSTTRHHLVLYFHAEVTDEQISQLKLQWDECDALFWISEETVLKVFDPERLEENKKETFEYFMHDGKKETGILADLKGVIEENGKYRTNRISTGTQYCLRKRYFH